MNGSAGRIAEGDLLCTLTSEGNLAMLKITRVVPNQLSATYDAGADPTPDYQTEATLFVPDSYTDGT